MLAYTYPLLDAFWTILWFFLFFLWIWLLIVIIVDVFRSHDLSGWGKAGWLIFILVLPLLGVLAYLIVRGGSMHERRVAEMRQQERDFRSYVKETAGGGSADELAKLADLKAKGVITEAEFQAGKAKVLG